MADTLPTVQISDGHGGFIIINESDFDPAVHKKFGEEPASDVDDPRTKAELAEAAEAKGLEVKTSMTKADISEMLDLADKPKSELIDLAEAAGIDTKGMTKAGIVEALKQESDLT